MKNYRHLTINPSSNAYLMWKHADDNNSKCILFSCLLKLSCFHYFQQALNEGETGLGVSV